MVLLLALLLLVVISPQISYCNEDTTINPQKQSQNSKDYKICNVLGGLDVTRYISRDARSFFAG